MSFPVDEKSAFPSIPAVFRFFPKNAVFSTAGEQGKKVFIPVRFSADMRKKEFFLHNAVRDFPTRYVPPYMGLRDIEQGFSSVFL